MDKVQEPRNLRNIPATENNPKAHIEWIAVAMQ
jgi:hypothetical protein